MLFYVVLAALMVFAIFRMWRGGGSHAPKVEAAFDRTEGRPEARQALQLLIERDWTGLARLYWDLQPSDRYHMVQGLGALAAMESVNWPEDPDSAILTIGGALRVTQAWKFRGGGAGAAVTRADVVRMRDSLETAHKLLNDAAARNPHDSTNIAWQIRVEMGLTGDAGRVNNLVGLAGATGEHNLFVALNHLVFFTPKWHGSIDEMWRVANQWASYAPNPAWLSIAARAHIEEWLFATSFAPPGSAERTDYNDRMGQQDFLDHVARLDDQFWAESGKAAMSGAEAAFAHNNFAFLLHILKLGERARRHLERMEASMTELPWGYLPTGVAQPTQLLATIRRQYGLPDLRTSSPRGR